MPFEIYTVFLNILNFPPFIFWCSVKPTEEPKALVIPLIKRNLWQSQKSYREDDEGQKRSAESSGQSEPASKKRKDEAKVEAGDALENEAVKEIMKGEWVGRTFICKLFSSETNKFTMYM